MPSVAERPPLPHGKKRRREDESLSLFDPIYPPPPPPPQNLNVSPFHFEKQREDIDIFSIDQHSLPHQKWHALVPRKIIPLPATKRQRVAPQPDPDAEGKRGRSAAENRVLQDQTDGGNRPVPSRTNSALLLAPCNVCHRRPTKKSDLDSFADCEGCGHRTCFVCMRECGGWLSTAEDSAGQGMEEDSVLSEQEVLSRSFHMDDAPPADGHDNNRSTGRGGNESNRNQGKSGEKGWAASGHRGVVCSRCCIEKGPDGKIVCLGCLSQMEGV